MRLAGSSRIGAVGPKPDWPAKTLAEQVLGMLLATHIAELPLAGHGAPIDNCRLHPVGCSCQRAGKSE